MANPLKRTLRLCAVATLALTTAAPAGAIGVRLRSNTLVRSFEDPDGNRATPAYEMLAGDVGDADEHGWSAHFNGWGRINMGDRDAFDDTSDGELLYGYAEYTRSEYNLDLRLGRQHVFGGVANDSIDGVRADADLSSLFSVTGYLGAPVGLSDTDGRAGDAIWGFRVGHHLGARYDVGVGYQRSRNDGADQEQVLGLDATVELPSAVGLFGKSTYNLETHGWGEHLYEADIPVGEYRLRPYFQRVLYSHQFGTGEKTGGPFRSLAESSENLTSVGLDLFTPSFGPLSATARVFTNTYSDREVVFHASGGLAWHSDELTTVGGELGRTDGKEAEDRYTLARAYTHWQMPWGSASGDLVYSWYDEKVNGERNSLFVSGTAGVETPVEALSVDVSVDYGSDPYFDRNFRLFAALRYTFDR